MSDSTFNLKHMCLNNDIDLNNGCDQNVKIKMFIFSYFCTISEMENIYFISSLAVAGCWLVVPV